MDGSYLGLTVTTGVAYAVVTVGMVLQLGYSRQLAFSQSVFMGVGAYGTGVLETKYNFSSLESLLAVIALAAVAAFLIGAVVTRAPGLALALATLLLPLFIYQLATFSGWLGSFSGIDGVALSGPVRTTRRRSSRRGSSRWCCSGSRPGSCCASSGRGSACS